MIDEKFIELVKDQFTYGGRKYALNNERESTDVLFETYGANWLFGTMAKYIYRFNNLARERDLLKIACYCYILWLKRGYWLKSTGLLDVLDTNTELKTKYYTTFVKEVNDFMYYTDIEDCKNPNLIESDSIEFHKECILELLKGFPFENFNKTLKNDILNIFCRCYLIWKYKYKNTEKHDTDTYNETK